MFMDSCMPLKMSIDDEPFITAKNSQILYKFLFSSSAGIKVLYSVGPWYIMSHWLILCHLLFPLRHQNSWKFLKRPMDQEMDLTSGHAATVVSGGLPCRDLSTLPVPARAVSISFTPLSFADGSGVWHGQKPGVLEEMWVSISGSSNALTPFSSTLSPVFSDLQGWPLKGLGVVYNPFVNKFFLHWPRLDLKTWHLGCYFVPHLRYIPEWGRQWC